MNTLKQNKKIAKKCLAFAENFILISYNPEDGVNIQTSVGIFAFTILGAMELAKQNLMAGFKDRAGTELSKRIKP